MNKLVVLAIIAINSAFILYTLAVISAIRAKFLNRNHAIEFWLGFICNIFGMGIMSVIENKGSIVSISKTTDILHMFSGGTAIILMLAHSLWATWVLYENNEKKKRQFHKLSILIWIIWLIPYGIGMYIGMFGS